MFLSRRSSEGQSFTIAWSKWLGTSMTVGITYLGFDHRDNWGLWQYSWQPASFSMSGMALIYRQLKQEGLNPGRASSRVPAIVPRACPSGRDPARGLTAILPVGPGQRHPASGSQAGKHHAGAPDGHGDFVKVLDFVALVSRALAAIRPRKRTRRPHPRLRRSARSSARQEYMSPEQAVSAGRTSARICMPSALCYASCSLGDAPSTGTHRSH